MESLQESTIVTPPASGLFGTKIPAAIAFLAAVLLFLLPFAEIKCNGRPMANNTGVGIALGSEWKEVVSKNLFGDDFENTDTNKKEFNQRQHPNIFALAALILGIAGFLTAFLNFKGAGKINLFIGLLAAASLIAMLIDLKSKAKSDNSIKSSELNLDVGVKISVNGTAWLYITVILFLAAAFFNWLRSNVKSG
ncbi:MAG TPA: hypothetical protein VGQ09_21790 [Chitinophagaceae bacterium]|jgi:drug/metabolite transporter superfamily protein YnfA|nr:hypothetical protein [Chitinophagaceae bacterium]